MRWPSAPSCILRLDPNKHILVKKAQRGSAYRQAELDSSSRESTVIPKYNPTKTQIHTRSQTPGLGKKSAECFFRQTLATQVVTGFGDDTRRRPRDHTDGLPCAGKAPIGKREGFPEFRGPKTSSACVGPLSPAKLGFRALGQAWSVCLAATACPDSLVGCRTTTSFAARGRGRQGLSKVHVRVALRTGLDSKAHCATHRAIWPADDGPWYQDFQWIARWVPKCKMETNRADLHGTPWSVRHA